MVAHAEACVDLGHGARRPGPAAPVEAHYSFVNCEPMAIAAVEPTDQLLRGIRVPEAAGPLPRRHRADHGRLRSGLRRRDQPALRSTRNSTPNGTDHPPVHRQSAGARSVATRSANEHAGDFATRSIMNMRRATGTCSIATRRGIATCMGHPSSAGTSSWRSISTRSAPTLGHCV